MERELRRQKEELAASFETPEQKKTRNEHYIQKRLYQAYKLKVDILGDPQPKRNNQQFVTFKKGGIYFQPLNPDKTLGDVKLMFRYKIGDPEYFERSPENDYEKEDSIFKLQNSDA